MKMMTKLLSFLFLSIMLFGNVSALSSGDGLIMSGAFASIMIASIFFFVLFLISENTAFRIGFVSFSVISFIAAVMFGIIILQENYATFTEIIDSYSAFYYVLGVLAGVGVLVLIIYTGYKAIRMIKIKKGLLDE